jgi:hypothetical protein
VVQQGILSESKTILAESDLILLRRILCSLLRGDSFSKEKSFSDLGRIFRREAPGRVEGSGQLPTYDHFSIFPPFGSSVHHIAIQPTRMR